MTSRRFSPGEVVVLATGNQGKLAELRPPLLQAGLRVLDMRALGLEAPEETAADFVGNALGKAVAASRAAGHPAIADDSGFEVGGLGGEPGLRSARWAAELGGYEAAMAAIRDRASADPDRRAAFVCALAVAWPDGWTTHVIGRVEGSWTWPPRGAGGFGYDPIFLPEGEDRTFAEMEAGEKAERSHRALALAGLKRECLP